ncbi:hypothetical protein Tco_0851994 [Tanacetum coccineum]
MDSTGSVMMKADIEFSVWPINDRSSRSDHYIEPTEFEIQEMGEVNPTHAYYNGSCTSKDTEDPSWSTSFKTKRTQKTSSALEVLWKTLFVLYLYLIGTFTPTTPPSIQLTNEVEETATMPHDSPLPRGHTPESDEGRLKHDELMELLVLKVKKLEKQVRFGKAKRRARIVLSDDKDADEGTSWFQEDIETQEKNTADTEVLLEEITQTKLIEDLGSDIYKDLFSMKVHYGGSFNPKVGREYILEVRFYHFMIPGINLDYCLVALGSDKEVKEIVIHVTRNELDDNMPPSPTNNEGFTKLYLQTPSSSKHLTISEAIQLKYEERERKRLIPIEGPFNSRPGVIYLGNLPLLRPCEIPWIDREDCRDDIGCSGSKGKEQEVEANGNEAYYFDPFEDLDDILRQYAKDNRVEAESHKAKLGEVEKEVDT